MKKNILLLILIPGVISAVAQTGSFTDSRDGHVYRTIKIGGQVWMAENLAYLPQIDRVEDGVSDKGRFWVCNYFGNTIEESNNTDSY